MPAGDIERAFTAGEEGAAWWDRFAEYHHDRYPETIAEARDWAGQAFEYVTAPGYQRIEVPDPDTFDFHDGDETVTLGKGRTARRVVYRAIPTEKRILRSDTGAHLITTTDSYEIIGVSEMWNIVEAVAKRGQVDLMEDLGAIAKQTGVRFETGGVLDGGRRIWALARLDEPWSAPGDPSVTYPYIAFLNSVDKSGSAKALNTTVRVVCANTFGMADAEGNTSGRQFNFRHTRKVHDRIEQAVAALQGLRDDTAEWQELAAALALTPVTRRQAELFVVEFIPKPQEAGISDRVARNVDEARDAIRQILASDTCKGIDGTAFGLVQAAGEYLDHVRGYRNRETLLNRQLLRPEKMKARAVTLARDVAASRVTDRQLAVLSR